MKKNPVTGEMEEFHSEAAYADEIHHKNKLQAEATVREMPREERRACKQADRASKHERYAPLTSATCPHKDTWNRAETLKRKNGSMPCLYAEEVRFDAETPGKKSKRTDGIQREIISDPNGEIIHWKDITVATEIVERRLVFRALRFFMNELQFNIAMGI